MAVYNAGTRVGPPARSYVKMDDSNLKEDVYKKTLVWIRARLHCTSRQTVSSWTGFNILVHNEEVVVEDATVQEVLRQSQKLKCSLGLESMQPWLSFLTKPSMQRLWRSYGRERTFSQTLFHGWEPSTLCALYLQSLENFFKMQD